MLWGLGLLLSWCASPGMAQAPAPTAAAAKTTEPAERQSAPGPEQLRSARATMTTYLDAVEDKNYALASKCLDFSAITLFDAQVDRAQYARLLADIIRELGKVDLAAISDDPQGPPYRFPVGQANAPVVLARDLDGSWRFTVDTVDQVKSRYNAQRGPWFYKVPYTNNEVWRLAFFAASILSAIVLGRVVRFFLERSATSFQTKGRELVAVALSGLARSTSLAIITVGLAVGLEFLILPARLEAWSSKLTNCLIAATIAYISWRLVDVVSHWLSGLSARTAGRLDDMLVPLVSNSLRGAIVVLALVHMAAVLSNSPVTSLIAGLGVGGLAIGLAAQDTIKNLFGSLMIFSDRPFELGDRIVVDGREGPVETVGFRSTRIRTGDGLVTIPNGDLANKAILNMGKTTFLKRSLTLRLASDARPEQVEQAVTIVKEILTEHDGWSPQRPPSVTFSDISETSLNIAVTYFVVPPDGARFSALNEHVNLEILRRFEQAGIQLATPSQRLELDERLALSLGKGEAVKEPPSEREQEVPHAARVIQ